MGAKVYSQKKHLGVCPESSLHGIVRKTGSSGIIFEQYLKTNPEVCLCITPGSEDPEWTVNSNKSQLVGADLCCSMLRLPHS
jgi:hypothetical protein